MIALVSTRYVYPLYSSLLAVGGFALARIVGPLAGIALKNPYNFYAALGLVAFNLLYNVFVLPESLPLELRQPFTTDALNPLSALKILNRHTLFRRLALAVGLSFCTISGILDVGQLYARSRFGFKKEDNALLSEVWGVCGIVVQLVLLPLLVRVRGARMLQVCACFVKSFDLCLRSF